MLIVFADVSSSLAASAPVRGSKISAYCWLCSQSLNVIATPGHGVFAVTGQGHLRLPATVRHWCGLSAGDRVLLAADPARGRLVVHPPAALDAMVAQVHACVLSGDAE